MSLKTPEKIRNFQKKLYLKAKAVTQMFTLNINCVFASVCYKVKSVGKPDAVVPHVRFDERRGETESW